MELMKLTSQGQPLEESFEKWAETVPQTLRNPLFYWTHLELKRYFNIGEILQPSSDKEIYKKANAILAVKTPIQLLEHMNVEVVCTTDDPTDDLQYHKVISKQNFYSKVFPTFRPDSLLLIEKELFPECITKLEDCVGFSVKNLESLKKAIQHRIDFFDENGCRLSDYGMEEIFTSDFTEKEADNIFKKRIRG